VERVEPMKAADKRAKTGDILPAWEFLYKAAFLKTISGCIRPGAESHIGPHVHPRRLKPDGENEWHYLTSTMR